MKYVLGIDLGTTAIKVAVFSTCGKKIASSTQEYDLITDSVLMVEQDIEVYWNAFKAGLVEMSERYNINLENINALSISSQGETMICLGEDGKPLRNVIVWMDNRAQEESNILEKKFNNEVTHKITGQVSMMAIWPAAKILWIKRNEPDIFNRVYKYLLLEDYFVYRMTGKFVAEGSLLCSTLLWDINTKKYWNEMLNYLGISEEQLPQIVEPGELIGVIKSEVSKELGLSCNIKVVMGALDQACGAIGVGNVRPGIFSESTGAALAVCTLVDKPMFDSTGQMPCFYGGIPNMYMIHSFTTGGIAMRWVRDKLCTEEMEVAERLDMDSYNLLDEEAEKINPGAEGLIVLPHFQGSGPPDSNHNAKAVVYGLTLRHTKAHIIRAFMESIAVTLYRMIEAVISIGIDIKEIRSLSGGAKSSLWNQIKADVTGISVRTMKNTSDAACLGAAILAGVAVGIWPSVADAADSIMLYEKIYKSNLENRNEYDKLIAGYKKLTGVLNDVTNEF